MYKHILVPTDGSSLSRKAVREAIRIAKASNARVTALHVLPKYNPPYELGMWVPDEKDYAASSHEAAKKILSHVQKECATAGVRCAEMDTFSDHPYEEIINTARKSKCDLVVMASHGRRGLAGVLLGSETQKVLTHAKTPVLVIR